MFDKIDNFLWHLKATTKNKESQTLIISIQGLMKILENRDIKSPRNEKHSFHFEEEPSLKDLEKRYIMYLWHKHGNQTKISSILGVSRSTLWRKFEEHGIEKIELGRNNGKY